MPEAKKQSGGKWRRDDYVPVQNHEQLTGKQVVASAHQEFLAKNHKAGKYVALPGGYTYDAQGRKQELKRQGLITRQPVMVNRDQSQEVAGHRYTVQYDKGWDDYNKMMKEMRHRVQSGVRSRRGLEIGARAGKFGPGQAQRISAASRAGQKRAGTLIASQFDE